MQSPMLRCGILIWLGATVALRLAGQYLFDNLNPIGTLLLFGVSFAAMAWLARALCLRLRLQREQWPAGAIAFALPTLLLDPFSSAFFPIVFPNIRSDMAGVFGGWMLVCCAGALAGVLIGATPHDQPSKPARG